MNYNFSFFYFFLICFFPLISISQAPLYSNVLVSDVGTGNNIGRANTSRNLAIANNGDIFVAFTGSMGIRVAKSSNRGQVFSPSVQVSNINSEPEIAINDDGDIFVAWIFNQIVMFSKSIDGGISFSSPISLGPGMGLGLDTGNDDGGVHIATYEDNVYLIDEIGQHIYSNNNNGSGGFNHTIRNRGYVYADIRTDQNGIVYVPSDDPSLFLFRSDDAGVNYTELNITPPGQVYFSSYALSDGPCGTFIFVGGGGDASTEGYKMDVESGLITPIAIGNSAGNLEGRTLFADNRGTFIDGYKNSLGDLVMNVSPNQGQTFSPPIIIAKGGSHNIDRNPFYEDIDVVYEQSGQVYLSVYNNLLKNIKVTRNDLSPLCPGDSFDLSYELSGVFDPSTELLVYLSDASGSFENKTQVGSIITNTNSAIQCVIPDNLSFGESYRVLIESAANCSQSNIATLSIGSISLNQLTDIKVCDDDNDGFFSFDTSNVESEVLQQLPTSGIIIEYFDGNGNVLPSPLPNPYTNVVQHKEEISIKVIRPLANCFSESKLVLEVFNTPKLNKLDDIFTCNEGGGFSTFDTSNIESQLIGAQTDLIIYYFDENDEVIPDFISENFQNKIAWSQNIKVRVENETNDTCFSEINFSLIVNELPQIDLEEEYLLCDLEPMLNLSTDSSFNQWEWVYQDGTIVSNSFDAELIEEGNYILNVGKIENGILCENSFSFTMVRSELPTIKEIRSQELSDYNFIEIIATGDGDFEYSIDGINYQNSNLFNNLLGGIYTATVRDKFDCGEDSLKVTIINYPKFFTPNNDGVNDNWQIKGITDYPAAKIFIYDRYGKLLKQISPNGIGWDGTYGGVLMNTTDFWFTVNLDNENSFKGHFSLKI